MRASPTPVDSEPPAIGRPFAMVDYPELRYQRLTRLAACLFDAPLAIVSLLDAEGRWTHSCCAPLSDELSRDAIVYAQAVLENGPLVAPDALRDPRLARSPEIDSMREHRSSAGMDFGLVRSAS